MRPFLPPSSPASSTHGEVKRSLTGGSVSRSCGQARKQDRHPRRHSNQSLATQDHQFHDGKRHLLLHTRSTRRRHLLLYPRSTKKGQGSHYQQLHEFQQSLEAVVTCNLHRLLKRKAAPAARWNQTSNQATKSSTQLFHGPMFNPHRLHHKSRNRRPEGGI